MILNLLEKILFIIFDLTLWILHLLLMLFHILGLYGLFLINHELHN
jgi:NADH:ubiquinone oxidoreductase subunit 3 (subunit A)